MDEIVSSAADAAGSDSRDDRRAAGRERIPRPVGLRDHDRERMGDDVVHVPRDAHALLLGDGIRLGQLLRRTVLAGAQRGAHEGADRPREQQREQRRHEHGERGGDRRQAHPAQGHRTAEDVDRDDSRPEDRRREAEPEHEAAAVGGGRVEHGEDREVDDARTPPEPHLHDGPRPGRGERDPRREPTDGERAGHQQRHEHGRERIEIDRPSELQLEGGDDEREQPREHHVDDEL